MELDFPILAKDRLDYVWGSYETKIEASQDKTKIIVHHEVSGQNLVQQLLKENRLAFAVEVSSPYATFRKLNWIASECQTKKIQEVSWDTEDIVPPIYIRPLVIALMKDNLVINLSDQHGVHKIWHGKQVNLLNGTILAKDDFWRTSSLFQSILHLVKDENMAPNTYRVEISNSEGFYFMVRLNSDFFTRMSNPSGAEHQRDSILTACLARGFELILHEYGDNEEWKSHPSLRALHNKLITEDLPTWEDENFHTDEVACKLCPIIFPNYG